MTLSVYTDVRIDNNSIIRMIFGNKKVRQKYVTRVCHDKLNILKSHNNANFAKTVEKK